MKKDYSFWVTLLGAVSESRYGAALLKVQEFAFEISFVAYKILSLLLVMLCSPIVIAALLLRGFRVRHLYSSQIVDCIILYHKMSAPTVDDLHSIKEVLSVYETVATEIFQMLSLPPDKQRIVIMSDKQWTSTSIAYSLPIRRLILVNLGILRGKFDYEWSILSVQEILLSCLLHELGHILKANRKLAALIDEHFANAVGFGLGKSILPITCAQRYLLAVFKYNVSGSRYGRFSDALRDFFRVTNCFLND